MIRCTRNSPKTKRGQFLDGDGGSSYPEITRDQRDISSVFIESETSVYRAQVWDQDDKRNTILGPVP